MQAECWPTAREIAGVLGKTARTIQRRANMESWPFTWRKSRGGKVKVYRLDMLPEDIRFAVDGNGGGAVAVWCPELTDWQNEKALAWADLIREYEKAKRLAKTRKRSVTAAAKEFVKGYNSGLLYPRLFELTGTTSYQSLERKLKKFKDNGRDYTVLAPAWGNRKGTTKVSDEEFHLVLSFALHPHRFPLDRAVRLAMKTMERRGIQPGCHKDTYKRAVTAWKKENYDRWVLMREGEKALNDKVLPYIQRDLSLLEVGDVLVADGHKLNFLIKDPFTGKDARMSLIVWYDMASRYPAGWEIMPTENTQCVAAGLRRAILALGKVPKVAYLDNGKAFKAKVFTDTTIDFEEAGFYGMFARLGIMTVFAWPYNAQSKLVERWFGYFSEFERMMPTYVGTSIDNQPARLKRNEKLHIKLHKKLFGDFVPDIHQAHEMIRSWVGEYAGEPKDSLGGRTPWEVFSEGRGPGVDSVALRHLMMNRTVRSIGRNGISLNGASYYSPELYGRKHRVLVKYDFGQPDSVLVCTEDGSKLICEAEAVKPLHPVARILGTEEDEGKVKAAIRMKRELKRDTEKELRGFIENTLAGNCRSLADTEARPTGTEALPAGIESKGNKELIITPGEAERIEREAAKLKVIGLKPKEEPEIALSEPARYEKYLRKELAGENLTIDQMRWMRWYEGTEDFKIYQPRFEMVREVLLAGEEENYAI
jgi:putative transposase